MRNSIDILLRSLPILALEWVDKCSEIFMYTLFLEGVLIYE